MAFVTIEDRVDRLEALFGQFMTETMVLNKRADERHEAAEERSRAADERMTRFEDEMRGFKNEMLEFKDEMRGFKNEMLEFKDEMRGFKNEMLEFKDEMRGFKDEMRQSKRDTDKKWGDLANKLGTIVEDILAPNLRRLAVEYFHFPELREIILRWNRKKPNTPSSWQEFDLVIVGPDAVIVGEAKSSANLESADGFAKKLEGFSEFAPHLEHLPVIPVLGCWSIPPSVVDRLSELGIYAMCMGPDTMEIVNGAAVRSR